MRAYVISRIFINSINCYNPTGSVSEMFLLYRSERSSRKQIILPIGSLHRKLQEFDKTHNARDAKVLLFSERRQDLRSGPIGFSKSYRV